MILSCSILDTEIIFSIPLSEKVFIKDDEILLKSLTVDLLKKYIWEREKNIIKDLTNDHSGLNLWNVNVDKVEDVFTDDDIVQKLRGKKMEPHFLFSNYFSNQPPAGKIHIIISSRPATTSKCLLMVYLSKKDNFAILFSI